MTAQETLASASQLPVGHLANGGAGTVVGVVDYGGDVAHKNFINGNGTTRFLSLWHQDGQTTPSSPFGYGREYTSQEINFALQQTNPYQSLNYDPADFEDPFDPGAHGTHVLDIAAGNGQGSTVAGMAPNADLIFVNISHAKDPDNEDVVGQSFGDSVRMLEALKYIFDRAGTQPCVVNISLGTNGGPHDGTTLVEQGIDSLLKAAPNRAVTISASNSFDDGIHAQGTVPQGGTSELLWEVQTLVRDIEMEVWYEADDRITVELIGPNGMSLATVSPGVSKKIETSNGDVAVLIANRLSDPNNNDNMIGIFLSAGMPGGTYTIRLHGDTISSGDFHSWIERDNRFQSRFALPHDNTHTIGSISCGNLTIAVGSYDAHKTSLPLSFFSSAGPTRDGREKPEVSAPGHAVRAAQSSTVTGTRLMSGTSMAAPAVAGLIALMLSEARSRDIDLTTEQIRDIIVDGARRSPPSGSAWHDRFGHGRVDASNAVQAVIDLADGGPMPAPANVKSRRKKKVSTKKKKVTRKKATRKKKAKKKRTRRKTSRKKRAKS